MIWELMSRFYTHYRGHNDALKAKQLEAFVAKAAMLIMVNMVPTVSLRCNRTQSDILVGCMYSSKAGQLPDNYLSANYLI